MIIGPERLKLLKELLDDNPQEVIEKINDINNKTHDRMKELLGVDLVILMLTFGYGGMAWFIFNSIKPIEVATFSTIFMWGMFTTVGLCLKLCEVGFSGLKQDALIVYRNLQLVGLTIRYKDLLLDEKKNSTVPTLKDITSDEYHNLMGAFRAFKLNVNPNEEISDEDFIANLFRDKQFDKILALVKLFPNKIEEYDARSANTSGKYSLLWQAAKVINEKKIPIPDDICEDLKLALETSKKYVI